MCSRNRFRHKACFVAGCVALFAKAVLSADVITSKSGGTIRGQIVADRSASGVAARTQTGALLAFAESETESPAPSPKSAAAVPSQGQTAAVHAKREASPRPAASHSRPKRTGRGGRLLSAEEKAWFPRVRSLVNRLFADEPAQVRRARAELLRISDPSALPALTRGLQDSPSDAARSLYVAILRQIPGDQSTALLIAQSLGDASPGVRADARQALDPSRAKTARRLYIDCLRTGSPVYYGLAARGLAEIGDPQLESIPYLIEALVEHTTQEVYEPGRPPLYSECTTEMIEASQPKFYSVPREEGRTDVLDALLKLTDQPYPASGYNVAKWREWFATRSNKAQRRDHRRESQRDIRHEASPGVGGQE